MLKSPLHDLSWWPWPQWNIDSFMWYNISKHISKLSSSATTSNVFGTSLLSFEDPIFRMASLIYHTSTNNAVEIDPFHSHKDLDAWKGILKFRQYHSCWVKVIHVALNFSSLILDLHFSNFTLKTIFITLCLGTTAFTDLKLMSNCSKINQLKIFKKLDNKHLYKTPKMSFQIFDPKTFLKLFCSNVFTLNIWTKIHQDTYYHICFIIRFFFSLENYTKYVTQLF